MAPSNAAVGNAGSVVLLALTCTVTAGMLYRLPSPALFDPNWTAHGFCVSNPGSLLTNSHALSFYADAVLAACIAALFLRQPAATTPPLQAAMLRGAITGVFGHGLGHLYLATEATGMDLRWRPHDLAASIPSTAVTVMAFAAIFQATMPLGSKARVAATAVVATAGFTVLDIEPKLNFVYAQAAIYVSNALHLLTLSGEDKSSAAYALYPYFQIPVLVVGVLESTACKGFLELLGGHAVFDASIGVVAILVDLQSRRLEGSKRSVREASHPRGKGDAGAAAQPAASLVQMKSTLAAPLRL